MRFQTSASKQRLSNLLISLSLIVSSVGLYSCVNAEARPVELPQVSTEKQADSNVKVYVCTGDGAYAYHNNRKCQGLGKCKVCIITVTKEQAEKEDRKPCGFCYGKKKNSNK